MVSRGTSLVLLCSVFTLCSLVASESSSSSSNVDDVSSSPPLPPGLEGLHRSSGGGGDDASSVAILTREEALAKLPASLSSASDDALADARLRAERLRDDYRARVASADERLAALRAETERLRAEEREWRERVSTNARRTSELLDERVPAHNARELRSLRDALATHYENDDEDEEKDEEDDDEEEEEEEEEDDSSYVTVEELESDMEDLLSPSQPWERELEERVTNVTKELLAEAFDEERRTAERELLRYEDRLLAARDAVVAENDSASSCTARDDLVRAARRALSLNPDVDDAVETDLAASPRVRVAHGDVEEEDPDAPGRRRRRPLTSPTRVSTPLGAVSAAVGATHERVLDPDTSRGACWPVAHRPGEEARLALVLARPAVVTAATIHHGRDSRSSAPRRLRVLGYGPCDDDDPTCASLGFDPRTSYVLTDGEEYDADRGGVAQTFRFADSGDTGATTTREEEEEEEKDDDSEPSFGGASAGQCSMPPPSEDGDEEVVPSCGGPPPVQEEPPVVKAVQLVVETNWGNPDYTCLYRFQVFGREVTTTSSS